MSRRPAASLPLWPEDHLQAALAALAAAGPPTAPTSATLDPACDFDPVEVPWASLPRSLPALAPAVLTLAAPFPGHLVLLAASRRRGLTLLAPDGSRRRRRPSRLARALRTLRTAAQDPAAAAVDALLAAPPLDRLPPTARRRARHALLAAHLAAAPGLRAHLAMAKPGRAAGVSRQGPRHPGPPLAPLLHRAAALAAAILAAQALSWLAWLTLGGAVLAGRIDAATELTWALLCLCLPAARALELAAANALASRAALRLRRRLFAATLALPPALLRADGIGRLLGRLLAIESCEASLLAAAPATGLALAELAGAAAALGHGTAPALHLALLAISAAAAGLLAIHRAGAERALAADQRALTGQLVEALAGHRTLRAQGRPPAEPSTGLAGHHAQLRALGTRELRLRTALPRAWLLAGLGALGIAASGAAPSPAALALSLGGLLLAQDALARLAAGLGHLATAWTAGQEILPILAGARAATAPAAATPTDSASAISSPPAPAASPAISPAPPPPSSTPPPSPSAPPTASTWPAPPAPARPPSPPSSPPTAHPTPASSSSTATTSRPSAPPPGAAASSPCRSSTPTTSSPAPSPGTFSSAAPGRPPPATSPLPPASASTSAWATSSTASPPASTNPSAKPAGSSPTAKPPASASPAPSSRSPISSSSTRASAPSIPPSASRFSPPSTAAPAPSSSSVIPTPPDPRPSPPPPPRPSAATSAGLATPAPHPSAAGPATPAPHPSAARGQHSHRPPPFTFCPASARAAPRSAHT